MQFESESEGSELELTHGLRQMRAARRWKPMGWMEAWSWSQVWLRAWPRAKTAAMEVEMEVWQLGNPWAEVWTRVEAKAWAEAEARGKADMWQLNGWSAAMGTWRAAWAGAEAGALALAGVWAWAVWARGEPQAGRQGVPSTLAESSTIRDILSDLNHYSVARDLWHQWPETRDEYSYIIHFITPITRLPPELLQQIFLIIIDETSGPPLALMLVCKHWHDMVTGIWGSLNLGTGTSMAAVTSKLESNQWLLDIVVDTDSDRGDLTPSDSDFEAIFAAFEASSRWRSLVVKSFPGHADLPDHLANRLQHYSNATMGRFTIFKIKSACEASPLLHSLLHILGTGTMANSELTTVEINSPNVISFLAPAYPSIFRSVKVLSLDTRGISDPVDLLPHLHQLESFTASHISFPTYHNDVDLPFVHSLRHLRLRAVSIQWMSGRTFHALEDCTLIFPLHQHVLHTFSTTLPNCKHLAFHGYPLTILGGVVVRKLTQLSVICSGSFNRRGSRQLVSLSCRVLGESRLRPKILHISVEAVNRAWVFGLAFMSNLEELLIYNARPSSLGSKVFQSLVVQPGYASNPSGQSTPGESCGPFCPSLRRFGLKYDRWLRPGERFNLIPDFVSVIRSRERPIYSLQSFGVWMTSNQKVPLELIERSQMSVKGFERLAKESGIEGYSFKFTDGAFDAILPAIEARPAVVRPRSRIIPSSD